MECVNCKEIQKVNNLTTNIEGNGSRFYDCINTKMCNLIKHLKTRNEYTEPKLKNEQLFFNKFGCYTYEVDGPHSYPYIGGCYSGGPISNGLGSKQFYNISGSYYYLPETGSNLINLIPASNSETSSIYNSIME